VTRGLGAWPLKRWTGLASSTVLVVAVGGWFFFLRPAPLGGPASYVMVSGVSMEPNLQDGDFVVARERPSYEIGDVVVYRVPQGEVGEGSLIIHRVIGGDEATGYVTQGDNPDIQVPDPWRPTSDDIMGSLWLSVPGMGNVLGYLRSPFAIALFAALVAFWIVATGGKKEEAEPSSLSPSPTEPEQSLEQLPELTRQATVVEVVAREPLAAFSEPVDAEGAGPGDSARLLKGLAILALVSIGLLALRRLHRSAG
jgi:signal peptidase I